SLLELGHAELLRLAGHSQVAARPVPIDWRPNLSRVASDAFLCRDGLPQRDSSDLARNVAFAYQLSAREQNHAGIDRGTPFA
ncbi:MAG TPA: hypothetical protein VER11_19920, partial [Polyangiaceae bacterium]|nr:hypothetical protein [Polyangiaceae bacterium]